MAASKQVSKDTHACVQCSHASMGLAQARPLVGQYGAKIVTYFSVVNLSRLWKRVLQN